MADTPSRLTIVRDPVDEVAGSGPARWAVEQLGAMLAERDIRTNLVGIQLDRPAATSGPPDAPDATVSPPPAGHPPDSKRQAATSVLADLTALDEPPPAVEYEHVPPPYFGRGQPVPIELRLRAQDTRDAIAVRLHYRHVNQAEAYEVSDMQVEDGLYRAIIPAAYTDSPHPLLYYFELRTGPTRAWLYPGLAEDLANRAFFLIRQG